MSTDHSGNYWIGSLNGEVCVLDSTQKQIMGKTLFPNDMIHTICGQESSNKVWVGTMSVSYTHLDVYKRQSQDCADIPLCVSASLHSYSCGFLFKWILFFVFALHKYKYNSYIIRLLCFFSCFLLIKNHIFRKFINEF